MRILCSHASSQLLFCDYSSWFFCDHPILALFALFMTQQCYQTFGSQNSRLVIFLLLGGPLYVGTVIKLNIHFTSAGNGNNSNSSIYYLRFLLTFVKGLFNGFAIWSGFGVSQSDLISLVSIRFIFASILFGMFVLLFVCLHLE